MDIWRAGIEYHGQTVWNIDPITRGLKRGKGQPNRNHDVQGIRVWNIDPITRGLKLATFMEARTKLERVTRKFGILTRLLGD